MTTSRAAPPSSDSIVVSMSPSAFVGRERELAAVRHAMARQPVVVLIEGEAGIGKTRLVREFLDADPQRARSTLTATCPPLRQPHTLSPLVDAVQRAAVGIRELRLSSLAGALRPLFPEWSDELPPAPERAEDATAARHRVFRALREVLDRLGVRLLVLEDAHWADEATLEFLLFLATPPQTTSLVLTYRPEDVPEGSLLPRLSRFATGGRRLSLGALDVAATAGLVSSMLAGEEVSDAFAVFVHEHTAGVPLAVEESVRGMVDRGDIFSRDGRLMRRALADIAVPPSLRDTVLERVHLLSREAVGVLWAIAVLGDPADMGMLRELTGLPPGRVSSGLGDALRSGMVVEDERGLMSFRHGLVSRVVYEAIPAPQRRILHLRAGSALERAVPSPVARLATHFRWAGDTAKWWRYAEQAADIALTPGDEVTASALLHELVVHAELPAATVARLTSKIAFTSSPGDAHCEELVRALRSVLDRPGLPRRDEAMVRAELGRVLGVMEDFEAGYAQMEQAAPHLPQGSAATARIMTWLGWAQGAIRPVSVHLRWLRRAAAIDGPFDPAERLQLFVSQVYGLLTLGQEEGWTQAARIPDDAPTAAERALLAVGKMNLGEIATTWGRYAEAERSLADALALAERDQFARCRAIVLVQQARLDWFLGNWDGLAQRVSALGDEADLATVTRLEAELVMGLLHAAAGSVARAEECLRRAYAGLRRHAGLECLEPVAALGRLYLAEGGAREALRLTEEPLDIVVDKGFWVHGTELICTRVAALVALEQADEAAGLVRAFARGLRGRDAPAARAALATCRAFLAEADDEPARAATAFARAADQWQALPRPYAALLAREHQVHCQLAGDAGPAALAALTEVAQALTTLGASADADRLAQELRRRGVAPVRTWRGGRRGYGDQLSPRELEVVRLLAAGHSTRQIAEHLSRSRDTVYSQLRSAMHKLDVTSRAALALRAAELNLI